MKEKLKAVENNKKILEFQQKIGLDPDVVTCDEQDIISALQVEGEIILTQYCIKKKILDACFPKYKLGIEFDELDHYGRNSKYEKNRQIIMESHGITIIRTKPDFADFDMNRLINQIYTHIIKWTKIQTEKLLVEDLLK